MAKNLWSTIHVLSREKHRAKGIARAQVRWARRALSMELGAGLVIGFITFAYWGYDLASDVIPRLYHIPESNPLLFSWPYILNGFDYIGNSLGVAIFSGLLWQTPAPSDDCNGDRPRCTESGSEADFLPAGQQHVFMEKVRELAGRGVKLQALLDFWQSLLKGDIMPSFDPQKSLTNDVVRQAIIPLSRDQAAPEHGYALATVWNEGQPVYPVRMVTHNWSNAFINLIASVVADCLGMDTYEGIVRKLITPEGVREISEEAQRKQVLDRTFWICAFSINQHLTIF